MVEGQKRKVTRTLKLALDGIKIWSPAKQWLRNYAAFEFQTTEL
jgi:hypothetical protein